VREAETQATNLRLKGRFFDVTTAAPSRQIGFYRVGTPGAPDIIECVDGKFVGLAVNTGTGEPATRRNIFFHALPAASIT
jgi:hypothetical protein